jgi:hypothetical protein
MELKGVCLDLELNFLKELNFFVFELSARCLDFG